MVALRNTCSQLLAVTALWTGHLRLTDSALLGAASTEETRDTESQLLELLTRFPEAQGLSWSEEDTAKRRDSHQHQHQHHGEQQGASAPRGITDEALARVGCNLRSLELMLCADISGRGVALALDRAPKMRVLSILSGGVMEDSRWISHAACARLEQLELACVALSAEAVSTVARHCTQLRVLSLGDVGDADFGGVGEEVAWPHLWSLELHAMRNVGGLLYAASAPGLLRQLDVTDCEFPPPTIRVVAERSPLLTELDLSGCSGVTDWTVAVVLRQCAALEWLELFACPRLTNHAANLIQRATGAGGPSPRLRSVGLSRSVDLDARQRLHAARPHLRVR